MKSFTGLIFCTFHAVIHLYSGSGKTTLLNAMSGRIPLTSGSVTINGSEINKQHRRRMGFVLQSDVFLSNLTLWETLYVSNSYLCKTATIKNSKNCFQEQLLLNVGQKYCRMLQESILQYFRPSLSYYLSLRPI